MKGVIQFALFLGILFFWIHIFGSAGVGGFIVSGVVGFVVGGFVVDLLSKLLNAYFSGDDAPTHED